MIKGYFMNPKLFDININNYGNIIINYENTSWSRSWEELVYLFSNSYLNHLENRIQINNEPLSISAHTLSIHHFGDKHTDEQSGDFNILNTKIILPEIDDVIDYDLSVLKYLKKQFQGGWQFHWQFHWQFQRGPPVIATYYW